MSLVVVHGRLETADVLSVVGDLDLACGPRFVSHAADAIRHGARRVVLDLQAVGFVDSAGLASLLNVLRRVEAVDGVLVLACPSDQLRRLLADTRLERHFRLADSTEAGEQALDDAA
jgi:anti-anti-sigma factor